jgi:hypothetical protein
LWKPQKLFGHLPDGLLLVVHCCPSSCRWAGGGGGDMVTSTDFYLVQVVVNKFTKSKNKKDLLMPPGKRGRQQPELIVEVTMHSGERQVNTGSPHRHDLLLIVS